LRGVPLRDALKAKVEAARKSNRIDPESAMRRAILAKDGAGAAAGDGTCILFFYLMDPKHRLLI
jgi:hypothetical protein